MNNIKKTFIQVEENNNYKKYQKLSDYLKLNMQSFQYLKTRNYKLAKSTFNKCIQLSKEIDEFKYVESLINYSISLYLNNDLEDSYVNLFKAKEISKKIYENSDEINQIYFIHLRCLGNMVLISLNLNKIENSKELINECISLIKEPKKKDIQIQISMLRELLYIFFRFSSLDKYYEINEKIIKDKQNNIKKELLQTNYNKDIQYDKALYNFHKSLKENNKLFWIKFLDKEIREIKNIKGTNNYLFLLLNKMASLYAFNEAYFKDDISRILETLLKYYYEKYNNEIIKDKMNWSNILENFKNKFNIAIKYYQELLNLEKELKNKAFELKLNNTINNENKIIIKLLLRNALKCNNLINNQNNQYFNEIKKQIEFSLSLIENNKINWNLLSIINIDSNLLKNINILFHNLKIIKIRSILRNNFHKYKLKTLGYINKVEKMKKKYIKATNFLKQQFLSLGDGSNITKFNFNSDGNIEHFYKLNISNKKGYLCAHKTITDYKPYKKFDLDDLYDITVGIKSKNLKSKLKPDFFNEYRPCQFLSLWFKERTLDLFFDNDEEMNKWFEGLYYYFKYVAKYQIKIGLNYYFFTKLKLKLLYKIIDMQYNLDIINKLNEFESQNPLAYQKLNCCKVINLYNKIYKEVCK